MTEIVVTAVVAVVSLILGGIVTRHYSSRRCLAIVVPSLFDVIDLRRIAKDKIQILYNKQNIESLWVVRVLVQNRGNVDIERTMVRRQPSVSFGDRARAIDVEAIRIPRDAVIGTETGEAGAVSFSIGYLQRRQQAAFQILVHSSTGHRLTAKNIIADTGQLENTKVDFVNFLSSGFPSFMETFGEFVRYHRKTFVFAYVVLSFGFIALGFLALLQPVIAKVFPTFVPLCEPAAGGIGFLLNGLLLMVPTWYLWRRLRYLSAFTTEESAELREERSATESNATSG